LIKQITSSLVKYSHFFIIIQIIAFTQPAQSQLKIKEALTAEELMSILLGDSENIIVSNVSIKGSPNSFGEFKCKLDYNDIIPEGVIMSNGYVKNAIGPNTDTQKSTKVNFMSDPDINRISGNKGCYDTALFEFDLISKTDKIQLNFFFASEEYPEYVHKNVNDTFIFLVTNTITKKSENIAVLNGDKNIPITVDYINHVTNSEYYIPNIPWNKETMNTYRDDIAKLELPFTFQYDGFTKLLNATVTVIPDVIYHFKLGISDVGDQLYDSAIFLEANSLRSIGHKRTLEEKINNTKDQLSVDFAITFEVSSDKIKDDSSFKLLDEIIQELMKHPEMNIEIIGHTDDSGMDQYNKLLSVKRAETVKNYLTDHMVNKSRVATKGVGAQQPKSDIKEENRRVEIIFIKEPN